MTPEVILRNARDLIVERGWTQQGSGRYDDPSVPYCVGLAMIDATLFLNSRDNRLPLLEAFKIFCEANGLRFKDINLDNSTFFHGVYDWNDNVCTSKQEAIAALDKAIDSLQTPPDVSFLDEIEFEIGDVDNTEDARELTTVS